MQSTRQIYIGTSGWHYEDWIGRFYPAGTQYREMLSYYAGHFNTVEVNSSFYRLPSKESILNWVDCVPDSFKFCIKASRYITHIKRLNGDSDFKLAVDQLFGRLSTFGSKLGCVLFQLPPNFKCDLSKIDNLTKESELNIKKYKLLTIKIAVEFRHSSWFNERTYQALARDNYSFVVSDHPYIGSKSRYDSTNFVYIRLHGQPAVYETGYSTRQLHDWQEFISREHNKNLDVFCFFNNDYRAHAVNNAKSLRTMLEDSF